MPTEVLIYCTSHYFLTGQHKTCASHSLSTDVAATQILRHVLQAQAAVSRQSRLRVYCNEQNCGTSLTSTKSQMDRAQRNTRPQTRRRDYHMSPNRGSCWFRFMSLAPILRSEVSNAVANPPGLQVVRTSGRRHNSGGTWVLRLTWARRAHQHYVGNYMRRNGKYGKEKLH